MELSRRQRFVCRKLRTRVQENYWSTRSPGWTKRRMTKDNQCSSGSSVTNLKYRQNKPNKLKYKILKSRWGRITNLRFLLEHAVWPNNRKRKPLKLSSTPRLRDQTTTTFGWRTITSETNWVSKLKTRTILWVSETSTGWAMKSCSWISNFLRRWASLKVLPTHEYYNPLKYTSEKVIICHLYVSINIKGAHK